MFNQIVLAGASEGLALGNMLFVLVAFLVLMLLLKKYAWGPVVKMMEKRAEKVAHDLDTAEDARQKAEEMAAKRSEQLQSARTEANGIVSDAKAAAGKQRDQIVADAHADAQATKEQASAQIAQERSEAMADVKSEVAELSVIIAQKIIQKELKLDDQKALIDAYIEGLGEQVMALDKATIAKRYAVALFELTHDQGTDETTMAELSAIREVLVQNPEFTKALLSLRINEDTKRQMLATLSEDASQVVKNLIEMTFDYRRIQYLPAIITKYEELVNKAAGIVNAIVQTAVPLSDEQVLRLKEKLVDRFQASEVRLTQIVDENILGGVIVKANDQILDGSLATKLAAIRQSIIR